MILQALHGYYSRLCENPDSGVALPGYAPQKFSYALVIDREGRLVQVQDIRNMSGKKPRPAQLMVPEAAKKSVNIAADFLWGNTGYVLGFDSKGKPARTRKTFDAFKFLHHEIGDSIKDTGMEAVLRFVDRWKPEKRPPAHPWDDIVGSNLVFRLTNELQFVHERPAVVTAWIKHKLPSGEGIQGRCLVTGEMSQIARLHNPIKGVYDPGGQAQKRIVSFNRDAFCSYGKEQNYNAPIGEEAAFAYTTALNHLLRFESRTEGADR